MSIINTSGKRKSAVARATLTKGSGKVSVNGHALASFSTKMLRLKISEPLILAGDHSKKYDVKVSVNGGGPSAQADAIRLAIARALTKAQKGLEKVYLNYDRQLLVADVRRKETHKPNRHGKARAKRQKSYR